MHDQHIHWSRIAGDYEREFIDPYRPDVRNPLKRTLRRLARREAPSVADLGCGIGSLLPFLADHFARVWAVDFAEGMLARAKTAAADKTNITWMQRSMTDLAPLHGQLDVAVAVNSLVMPDPRVLDASLREIRACLKPGGYFLGILPALDAVHYLTMLLVDRALNMGQPPDAARQHAAHHNDHADYDFAFGDFHFQGLHQHFWQPFEIGFRFQKAGFRIRRLKKVRLAWRQFSCWRELQVHPAPWDWFFVAKSGASTSPK